MNFAGEAPPPALPVSRLLFINRTMRSGSANGMGLSTTVFTTEKIAVLAPMPIVQRRNRGEGEARALSEHLERVFQVLEEGLHLGGFQPVAE